MSLRGNFQLRTLLTCSGFWGNDVVPITIGSHIDTKEIVATPVSPYDPSTSYKLVIRVENGKDYQMDFYTGF